MDRSSCDWPGCPKVRALGIDDGERRLLCIGDLGVVAARLQSSPAAMAALTEGSMAVLYDPQPAMPQVKGPKPPSRCFALDKVCAIASLFSSLHPVRSGGAFLFFAGFSAG